ncbi:hypothetical protein [Streptomyces goshikiensis]|uniref:hypothetical protein n=1 Tax=Streptomyces goshikiensis TaxID=1942 RepID=UPI002E0E2B1B|nr:hypothetical protein OG224_19020 [Streptomyces goshikiensis]
MPRAKWVVGGLTVALLCTGVGMLRGTEGAAPAATTTDALPSHALGLSGHRRLVRQLEQAGEHAPGKGARPARSGVAPLHSARPLRLRIPSLGVDVPLEPPAGRREGPGGGHGSGADGSGSGDGSGAGTGTGADTGVTWDADRPTPGAAGIAVVTGNGLRLAGLRRGATIEIARADHRTAVFTVERISPAEARGGGEDPAGPGAGPVPAGRSRSAPGHRRAGLRLLSGESAVLARLTGRHRTG